MHQMINYFQGIIISCKVLLSSVFGQYSKVEEELLYHFSGTPFQSYSTDDKLEHDGLQPEYTTLQKILPSIMSLRDVSILA